jgi:hypothetical protein
MAPDRGQSPRSIIETTESQDAASWHLNSLNPLNRVSSFIVVAIRRTELVKVDDGGMAANGGSL